MYEWFGSMIWMVLYGIAICDHTHRLIVIQMLLNMLTCQSWIVNSYLVNPTSWHENKKNW